MQQNFPAPDAFLSPPPWQMQSEDFILNHWLTPSFIWLPVLLVRCRSSPVGPYDELLI